MESKVVLCMCFFSITKLLPIKKLYLFVDKKVLNRFEGYDNKKIVVLRQRTWSAVQYTFAQAGEYQVSIADTEKISLLLQLYRLHTKRSYVLAMK